VTSWTRLRLNITKAANDARVGDLTGDDIVAQKTAKVSVRESNVTLGSLSAFQGNIGRTTERPLRNWEGALTNTPQLDEAPHQGLSLCTQ
jgi:hypothetical protein